MIIGSFLIAFQGSSNIKNADLICKLDVFVQNNVFNERSNALRVSVLLRISLDFP